MKEYEDLSGQIFDRLKVIKYAYSKHGSRYWLCECSCGNREIYVTTSHLKSGHTTSCGCKSKKDNGIFHYNFKGNKYEDFGEFLIGVDAKENQFKISKEDYEECRKYCWTGMQSRNPKKGKYFSARMSRKSLENHKMKMLHNFIWELHNNKIPEGYIVDHIDRDGSNCCIDNLRLATFSQNNINKDLSVKNKSGIIGVCYDPKSKKWSSFITINKHRIEFSNQEDMRKAIKLRLEAEAKYFGNFAPQKHLFKQYGIEVEDGK